MIKDYIGSRKRGKWDYGGGSDRNTEEWIMEKVGSRGSVTSTTTL